MGSSRAQFWVADSIDRGPRLFEARLASSKMSGCAEERRNAAAQDRAGPSAARKVEIVADVTDRARDEERWAGLMASAQAGDEDAYTRLLDDLYDVIARYVGRILGQSPWIEDCVQDCLMAIHRARHSYDRRRPFRPWLFTIVRHKAIDALRRDARRPEVLTDVETVAPESDSAEHRLDAQRLLDLLSAPYRDALVLTKIRGYSIAEAAKATGVSAPAMKSRVHRAMRELVRLVEADLEVI